MADFMASLRRGYCLVPQPFNTKVVTRVSLEPGDVTCIVFWTRDPRPLMAFVPELDALGYPFYVQMTLTGYPRFVEPRAPRIDEARDALCALSDELGPERVIWRYDPIFLAKGPGLNLDAEWHCANFCGIAESVGDRVRTVVISLLDEYRCTKSRMARAGLTDIVFGSEREHVPELPPGPFDPTQGGPFFPLLTRLAACASSHGLSLKSCAEPWDLSAIGISRGACVDAELISHIAGKDLRSEKDKGQRPYCGCAESVDVGTYGKCPAGCIYCYAKR